MNEEDAKNVLEQADFTPQFVASGMESFVFDIGNNQLAKVWIVQRLEDVQRLKAFYEQLSEKKLPFATPFINEILETRTGSPISIEQRIRGVPLQSLLQREPENELLQERGRATVVAVVEALSNAGDIPAARQLALLGTSSLWTPEATWGIVIARLVALRANRYRSVLESVVDNFERKLEHIVSLLKAVHTPQLGVIHGDICTQNILVDEETWRPGGLLDFGFLSTSADPLFDAVISTLIFDMYSPHALTQRANLHKLYARKWLRFADVYPLYKAAYALATSNAYSESGEDGHFRWCVDILNDAETRALLRS